MVIPDGDERALIRRAQSGDAEAVAALYLCFLPAVFRYLYLRVRDQHVAEDLTGEVFLKMVEGLPRYVDRDLPFAAWLFRIAHSRLVDHFRRSRLRQAGVLSETFPDGHESTEKAALQRVETRTLYERLRGLTDEQQL